MTKVVFTQPSLARYRIPVFQELAKRPGIDLKVVYGTHHRISNAEATGFDAEASRLWQCKIRGSQVSWLPAQVKYCAGRDTDVTVLTWDLHYASLLPALLRARKSGHPTILWGHGFSKNDCLWQSRLRNNVGKLATCLLVYDGKTAGGPRPRRIRPQPGVCGTKLYRSITHSACTERLVGSSQPAAFVSRDSAA